MVAHLRSRTRRVHWRSGSAPSNPNIIYAGTGESDIRSNLASGDGVYKSTDAGKTWQNIGLKDSRQISRIAVHPTNANILFVAALGHAYAPNDERGVFRSTDGGSTWEKVLYKGPSNRRGRSCFGARCSKRYFRFTLGSAPAHHGATILH